MFTTSDWLRAGALASATATLLLAGSSVATALFAASLTGGAIGVATGAPTGLMLKSVLMAASWLPSSQIPTPLPSQLCASPLNVVLENALNIAAMPARLFD